MIDTRCTKALSSFMVSVPKVPPYLRPTMSRVYDDHAEFTGFDGKSCFHRLFCAVLS